MSELDKLLQGYVPPPVPTGLAQRAAAEAIKHSQDVKAATWPRRDRRGGWKRPLWIGAAGFGLAFTSAVAATVVSGGRIEIPVVQPVVQEVVEAVPVLYEAQAKRAPERVAEAKAEEPEPRVAGAPQDHAVAVSPGQPGWRKAQVKQKLTIAKQRVEQRRAAGLPTPRADRIERQAKTIVEQRKAAGLPAPSVEQVEAGLALREIRQVRQQRLSQQTDPSAITDAQIARFAGRLSADKRERFEALSPEMQRRLVARTADRIRARRAVRQMVMAPTSEPPQ
jgi:hypothetical protein